MYVWTRTYTRTHTWGKNTMRESLTLSVIRISSTHIFCVYFSLLLATYHYAVCQSICLYIFIVFSSWSSSFPFISVCVSNIVRTTGWAKSVLRQRCVTHTAANWTRNEGVIQRKFIKSQRTEMHQEYKFWWIFAPRFIYMKNEEKTTSNT